MGTRGKQRSYDRSFKERAVKLSEDRDNIKYLSSELGISPERIYKWRNVNHPRSTRSWQGLGVGYCLYPYFTGIQVSDIRD